MVLDIMGILAIAVILFYVGNAGIVVIISNFFSTGEGLSTMARAIPFMAVWSIGLVVSTLLYIGSLF